MKGYDNFFLPVGDLKQAGYYYGQMLGLDVKFDFSAKGMLAYRIGREEPAVILRDTSHFPIAQPAIWFLVDDARRKYNELREKGVAFNSEPFAIATGTAVEFEDPFGNRLGITDYIKR
ncbi:VOC family protein [Paenibacillus macerans]|uniref:VOC family protein n=1 Tax=Paenibacillus macerans TaxID=44252 RepID=A0A6N8EXS4_PAEMA|nr:VOC family protein [Paenibacillus macerans]MBS5910072.1 VOC family protein [Paenibacillus macerans]MDU5946406.1 VOC family protein [Paenibacillus macerans]MEC0135500.1 VOC family protein [Paenibacillus macerans]MEC0328376.1 VOC family protein [Paenibacillus macerans]MUG23191.1 VOC family protein [Paenibacillus macerans]